MINHCEFEMWIFAMLSRLEPISMTSTDGRPAMEGPRLGGPALYDDAAVGVHGYNRCEIIRSFPSHCWQLERSGRGGQHSSLLPGILQVWGGVKIDVGELLPSIPLSSFIFWLLPGMVIPATAFVFPTLKPVMIGVLPHTTTAHL